MDKEERLKKIEEVKRTLGKNKKEKQMTSFQSNKHGKDDKMMMNVVEEVVVNNEVLFKEQNPASRSTSSNEKIIELEETLIGKQHLIDSLIEENELLKAQMNINQDYKNSGIDVNLSVEDKEVLSSVQLHSSELEKLEEAIRQRDETIKRLMENVQSLTRNRDDLQNEYTTQIDQLTGHVHMLQSQLKQTGQWLNNQLGETSSLALMEARDEILALQKDSSHREAQLKALQEAIKQRDAAMQLMVVQINETNINYTSIRNEIQILKIQLEEKEEQLIEFEQTARAANKTTGLQEKSSKVFESFKDSFKIRSGIDGETTAAVEGVHDSGRERQLAALRAELDEFYGVEIGRIKDFLNTNHRSEINRLKEEVRRLDEERSRHSQQASRWQEQYMLLSQQNVSSSDLVQEIGNVITENIRLNQLVDELRTHIKMSSSKTSISSSESISRTPRGEIDGDANAVTWLEKGLQELEKLRGENEAMGKMFYTKDQLIQELEDNMTSLREEMQESFDVEKKEFQEKMKNDYEAAFQKSAEEIQRLVEERSKLSQEVSSWQRQYLLLGQQNVSSTDLVERISSVVTENIRLNQLVDELNSKSILKSGESQLSSSGGGNKKLEINGFNADVSLKQEIEELRKVKSENEALERSFLTREQFDTELEERLVVMRNEIMETSKQDFNLAFEQATDRFESDVSRLKEELKTSRDERSRLEKELASWREQYIKLSQQGIFSSDLIEELNALKSENLKLTAFSEERNARRSHVADVAVSVGPLVSSTACQCVEAVGSSGQCDLFFTGEQLEEEVDKRLALLRSEMEESHGQNIINIKEQISTDLSEELEKLRKQLKSTTEERDKYFGEVSLWQNQYVLLSQQNLASSDLVDRINFLMTENHSLKGTISDLNSQLRSVTNELNQSSMEYDGRMNEAGRQIEKLQSDVAALNSSLAEETESKSMKSGQIGHLESKLLVQQEKYNESIAKFKEEIQSSAAVVDDFRARLFSSETDGKKLAYDKDQEIGYLKRIVDDLKSTYESRLLSLRNENAVEVNSLKASHQREYDGLRRQYGEETAKLTSMISDLKSSREFTDEAVKNEKESLKKHSAGIIESTNNRISQLENELKTKDENYSSKVNLLTEENEGLKSALHDVRLTYECEAKKMNDDNLTRASELCEMLSTYKNQESLLSLANGKLAKVTKERDSAIESLQNVYSEKVELKQSLDKLISEKEMLQKKVQKLIDKNKFLTMARSTLSKQSCGTVVEAPLVVEAMVDTTMQQSIPLSLVVLAENEYCISNETKVIEKKRDLLINDQEYKELMQERQMLEAELSSYVPESFSLERNSMFSLPAKRSIDLLQSIDSKLDEKSLESSAAQMEVMGEMKIKYAQEMQQVKRKQIALIDKLQLLIESNSSTLSCPKDGFESSVALPEHQVCSGREPGCDVGVQCCHETSEFKVEKLSVYDLHEKLISFLESMEDLQVENTGSIAAVYHRRLTELTELSREFELALQELDVSKAKTREHSNDEDVLRSTGLSMNRELTTGEGLIAEDSFKNISYVDGIIAADVVGQHDSLQFFNISTEPSRQSDNDEELSPAKIVRETCRQELWQLRSSLSDANEEIQKLLSEKESLSREFDAKVSLLLKENDVEKESLEVKVTSLKEEVNGLKEKLKENSQCYEKLLIEKDSELSFARAEIEKLGDSQKGALNELVVKHEEKELELTHALCLVKKQLSDTELKIEVIHKEKTTLEHEFVSELEGLTREHDSRIKSLKESYSKENVELSSTLAKLQEEFVNVSDELEFLQHENSRLSQQLSSAKTTDGLAQKSSRKAASPRLSPCFSAEETWTMRLNSLQESKTEAEQRLKNMTLDLERVKSHNSRLIDELNILKERESAKTIENFDSKVETDPCEAEKKIESLRQEKALLASMVERLTLEKDQLLIHMLSRSQTLELDLSSMELETEEIENEERSDDPRVKLLEAEKELLANMLEKVSAENERLLSHLKVGHSFDLRDDEGDDQGRETLVLEESMESKLIFKNQNISDKGCSSPTFSEQQEAFQTLETEKRNLELTVESLNLLLNENKQTIDLLRDQVDSVRKTCSAGSGTSTPVALSGVQFDGSPAAWMSADVFNGANNLEAELESAKILLAEKERVIEKQSQQVILLESRVGLLEENLSAGKAEASGRASLNKGKSECCNASSQTSKQEDERFRSHLLSEIQELQRDTLNVDRNIEADCSLSVLLEVWKRLLFEKRLSEITDSRSRQSKTPLNNDTLSNTDRVVEVKLLMKEKPGISISENEVSAREVVPHSAIAASAQRANQSIDSKPSDRQAKLASIKKANLLKVKKLQEKSMEKEALEQEVSELRKSKNYLENANDSLAKELEGLRSLLLEKESSMSRLHVVVDTSSVEVQAEIITGESQGKEIEKCDKETAVDDFGDFGDFNSVENDLREEILKLKSELKTAKCVSENLHAEYLTKLGNTETAVTELTGLLKNAESEKADLIFRLGESTATLERLRAEEDILNKEKINLETTILKLLEDVNELKPQNNLVAKLNEENSKMHDHIARLEISLEERSAQLLRLNEILAERNDSEQAKSSEAVVKQENLHHLHQDSPTPTHQLDIVGIEKLDLIKETSVMIKAPIGSKKEAIPSMQLDEQTLLSKLNECIEKINSKDKEIDNLQDVLSGQNEKVSILDRECSEKSEKISILLNEVTVHSSEAARLKQELTKKVEEVVALESKLSSLTYDGSGGDNKDDETDATKARASVSSSLVSELSSTPSSTAETIAEERVEVVQMNVYRSGLEIDALQRGSDDHVVMALGLKSDREEYATNLENELSDLRVKLATLATDLNVKNNLCSHLEAELEVWRTKSISFEGDLENKTSEVNSLKTEMASLKDEISTKSEQIMSHDGEMTLLAERHDLLSTKDASMEQLQKDLDLKRLQFDEIKTEWLGLSAELEECKKREAKNSEEAAMMKDDISRLSEEKRSSTESLNALVSEFDAVKAEVQQLNRDLSAKNDVINSLSEESNLLRSQVDLLGRDKEAGVENEERLRIELTSVNEELLALRNEVSALFDSDAQLKLLVDSLKGQLATLGEEKMEVEKLLKAEIEFFKSSVASSSRDVKNLNEEKLSLETRLKELNDHSLMSSNDLRSALSDSETARDELTVQVKELIDNLEKQNEDYANNVTVVSALQDELAEVKERLVAEQSKYLRMKEESEKWQSSKEEEVTVLVKSLADFEAQVKADESDLERCRLECKELKDVLREKSEAIEKLEGERSELKMQLVDLERLKSDEQIVLKDVLESEKINGLELKMASDAQFAEISAEKARLEERLKEMSDILAVKNIELESIRRAMAEEKQTFENYSADQKQSIESLTISRDEIIRKFTMDIESAQKAFDSERDAFSQQILDLTSQNARIRQTCSESETNLKQLTLELERTCTENTNLRNTLESERIKYNLLLEQEGMSSQKMLSLESEVVEKSKTVEDLMRKCTSLESDLKASSEELTRSNGNAAADAAELRAQVIRSSEEGQNMKDHLTSRLVSEKNLREKLEDDVEFLKSSLEGRSCEVESLKEALSRKSEEFDDLKKFFEVQEVEGRDVVDALQEEISILKEKLKLQDEKLKEVSQNFVKEYRIIEEQLNLKSAAVDESRSMSSKLEAMVDEYRTKCQEHEDSMARFTEQIELLKNDNECTRRSYIEKCDEVETIRSSHERLLENSSSDKTLLDEKLSALTREMNSRDSELIRLKGSLSALEDSLQDMERNSSIMENDVLANKAKLDEKENLIEKLESTIASDAEKLSSMVEELSSKNLKLDHLKDSLIATEDRLNVSEIKSAELKKCVCAKEEMIKNLKSAEASHAETLLVLKAENAGKDFEIAALKGALLSLEEMLQSVEKRFIIMMEEVNVNDSEKLCTISNLESSARDLRDLLESERLRAKQSSLLLENSQEELLTVRSGAALLNSETSERLESIERLKTELNDCNEALSVKTRESEDLKNENDCFVREILEMKEKINEMQAEKLSIDCKLSEKNDEILNMAAVFKEKDEEINRLMSSCDDLKQNLEHKIAHNFQCDDKVLALGLSKTEAMSVNFEPLPSKTDYFKTEDNLLKECAGADADVSVFEENGIIDKSAVNISSDRRVEMKRKSSLVCFVHEMPQIFCVDGKSESSSSSSSSTSKAARLEQAKLLKAKKLQDKELDRLKDQNSELEKECQKFKQDNDTISSKLEVLSDQNYQLESQIGLLEKKLNEEKMNDKVESQVKSVQCDSLEFKSVAIVSHTACECKPELAEASIQVEIQPWDDSCEKLARLESENEYLKSQVNEFQLLEVEAAMKNENTVEIDEDRNWKSEETSLEQLVVPPLGSAVSSFDIVPEVESVCRSVDSSVENIGKFVKSSKTILPEMMFGVSRTAQSNFEVVSVSMSTQTDERETRSADKECYLDYRQTSASPNDCSLSSEDSSSYMDIKADSVKVDLGELEAANKELRRDVELLSLKKIELEKNCAEMTLHCDGLLEKIVGYESKILAMDNDFRRKQLEYESQIEKLTQEKRSMDFVVSSHSISDASNTSEPREGMLLLQKNLLECDKKIGSLKEIFGFLFDSSWDRACDLDASRYGDDIKEQLLNSKKGYQREIEELWNQLEEIRNISFDLQNTVSNPNLSARPGNLKEQDRSLEEENLIMRAECERLRGELDQMKYESERACNAFRLSCLVQSDPNEGWTAATSETGLGSGVASGLLLSNLYSPDLKSPASYSGSETFLMSDDGRMSCSEIEELHTKVHLLEKENSDLRMSLNRDDWPAADSREVQLNLSSTHSGSSYSSLLVETQDASSGDRSHFDLPLSKSRDDFNASEQEFSPPAALKERKGSSLSFTSLNAERFLVRSPRSLVSTSNDYQLEAEAAVGKTSDDYVCLQTDYKRFKVKARSEYTRLKNRLIETLKDYNMLRLRYKELCDSATFNWLYDKRLLETENNKLRDQVEQLGMTVEQLSRDLANCQRIECDDTEDNREKSLDSAPDETKILMEKISQLDLQMSILQSDCNFLSERNALLEKQVSEAKPSTCDECITSVSLPLEVHSIRPNVQKFHVSTQVDLEKSPLSETTDVCQQSAFTKNQTVEDRSSTSTDGARVVITSKSATNKQQQKKEKTAPKAAVKLSSYKADLKTKKGKAPTGLSKAEEPQVQRTSSSNPEVSECHKCKDLEGECNSLREKVLAAEKELELSQVQNLSMSLEDEFITEAGKHSLPRASATGRQLFVERDPGTSETDSCISADHQSQVAIQQGSSTTDLARNVQELVKSNEKLLLYNRTRARKLKQEFEVADKEIKILKSSSLAKMQTPHKRNNTSETPQAINSLGRSSTQMKVRLPISDRGSLLALQNSDYAELKAQYEILLEDKVQLCFAFEKERALMLDELNVVKLQLGKVLSTSQLKASDHNISSTGNEEVYKCHSNSKAESSSNVFQIADSAKSVPESTVLQHHTNNSYLEIAERMISIAPKQTAISASSESLSESGPHSSAASSSLTDFLIQHEYFLEDKGKLCQKLAKQALVEKQLRDDMNELRRQVSSLRRDNELLKLDLTSTRAQAAVQRAEETECQWKKKEKNEQTEQEEGKGDSFQIGKSSAVVIACADLANDNNGYNDDDDSPIDMGSENRMIASLDHPEKLGSNLDEVFKSTNSSDSAFSNVSRQLILSDDKPMLSVDLCDSQMLPGLYSSLKNDYDLLAKHYYDLQTEKQYLLDNLLTLKSNEDVWLKRIDSLLADLRECQAETLEVSRHEADLRGKLSEQEVNQRALLMEIEGAGKSYSDLRKMYDELNLKSGSFESVSAELINVQDEKTNILTEFNKILDDNAALKQKIESLILYRDDYKSLEARNCHLQDELVKSEQLRNYCCDELELLKQKMLSSEERSANQLNSLECYSQSLALSLCDKGDELMELRRINVDLRSEINTSNEINELLKNEIVDLNKKLEALNRKCDLMREDFSEVLRQKSITESELQDCISSLNCQLFEHCEKSIDYDNLIDMSQKQNVELVSEMDRIKLEFINDKNHLEETVNSVLDEIKSKNRVLKDFVSHLLPEQEGTIDEASMCNEYWMTCLHIIKEKNAIITDRLNDCQRRCSTLETDKAELDLWIDRLTELDIRDEYYSCAEQWKLQEECAYWNEKLLVSEMMSARLKSDLAANVEERLSFKNKCQCALSQCATSVAGLSNEFNVLKSFVVEFMELFNSMNASLKDFPRQLNALYILKENEAFDLNFRLSDVGDKLVECLKEKGQLEDENKSQSAKVEELVMEIKGMQIELRNAHQRNAELELDGDEMKNQILLAVNEAKKLSEVLLERMEANKTLRDKLSVAEGSIMSLNHEINALSDEIKLKSEDAEKLSSELDHFKSKNITAVESFKQVSNYHELLSKKCSELEATNEALSFAIKNYEIAEVDKMSEIDSLKASYAKLEDEFHVVTEEKDRLLRVSSDLETVKLNLGLQVEVLSKALDFKDSVSLRLEKKFKVAEAENRDLLFSLSDSKVVNSKLQEGFCEMKEDWKRREKQWKQQEMNLRGHVDRKKDEIENLEKLVEALRSEVSCLQLDLKVFKDNLSCENEKLQILMVENSQLKNENGKVMTNLRNIEDELNERRKKEVMLREELAVCTKVRDSDAGKYLSKIESMDVLHVSEKTDLLKQRDELAALCEELKSEKSALVLTLGEIQKNSDDRSVEFSKLVEDQKRVIDQIEIEHFQLKSLNEKLMNDLVMLESDKKALVEMMKKMKEDDEILHQEVMELSNGNKVIQNSLQLSCSEVEKLRDELMMKTRDIDELAKSFSDCCDKFNEKSEENEMLKEKLSHLYAKDDSLTAENLELVSTVRNLTDRVGGLIVEINELQNQQMSREKDFHNAIDDMLTFTAENELFEDSLEKFQLKSLSYREVSHSFCMLVKSKLTEYQNLFEAEKINTISHKEKLLLISNLNNALSSEKTNLVMEIELLKEKLNRSINDLSFQREQSRELNEKVEFQTRQLNGLRADLDASLTDNDSLRQKVVAQAVENDCKIAELEAKLKDTEFRLETEREDYRKLSGEKEVMVDHLCAVDSAVRKLAAKISGETDDTKFFSFHEPFKGMQDNLAILESVCFSLLKENLDFKQEVSNLEESVMTLRSDHEGKEIVEKKLTSQIFELTKEVNYLKAELTENENVHACCLGLLRESVESIISLLPIGDFLFPEDLGMKDAVESLRNNLLQKKINGDDLFCLSSIIEKLSKKLLKLYEDFVALKQIQGEHSSLKDEFDLYKSDMQFSIDEMHYYKSENANLSELKSDLEKKVKTLTNTRDGLLSELKQLKDNLEREKSLHFREVSDLQTVIETISQAKNALEKAMHEERVEFATKLEKARLESLEKVVDRDARLRDAVSKLTFSDKAASDLKDELRVCREERELLQLRLMHLTRECQMQEKHISDLQDQIQLQKNHIFESIREHDETIKLLIELKMEQQLNREEQKGYISKLEDELLRLESNINVGFVQGSASHQQSSSSSSNKTDTFLELSKRTEALCSRCHLQEALKLRNEELSTELDALKSTVRGLGMENANLYQEKKLLEESIKSKDGFLERSQSRISLQRYSSDLRLSALWKSRESLAKASSDSLTSLLSVDPRFSFDIPAELINIQERLVMAEKANQQLQQENNFLREELLNKQQELFTNLETFIVKSKKKKGLLKIGSSSETGGVVLSEIASQQLKILQEERDELMKRLNELKEKQSKSEEYIGKCNLLEETLKKERELYRGLIKEKENLEVDLLQERLNVERQLRDFSRFKEMISKKERIDNQLIASGNGPESVASCSICDDRCHNQSSSNQYSSHILKEEQKKLAIQIRRKVLLRDVAIQSGKSYIAVSSASTQRHVYKQMAEAKSRERVIVLDCGCTTELGTMKMKTGCRYHHLVEKLRRDLKLQEFQ